MNLNLGRKDKGHAYKEQSPYAAAQGLLNIS
jgi:hypothetical protein